MKNISLRAFRTQIHSLTEPVEVSRRDSSGNIQILGYWTPYAQHPADATPLAPLAAEPLHDSSGGQGSVAGHIRTPADAVAVAGRLTPFSPAPKPSQTKRR